MKAIKLLTLAGAVALVAALGASSAKAGFAGRSYYGGWQRSGRGYFFSSYFYKPYVGYPSYCYNYAIYFPAAPNFVYYFNPYKGTYWGRFNVNTKGYSLLAEKDRKGALSDIPEKAFPKEGPLPLVPDAKDPLTLDQPPQLPAADKTDDVLTPAPGDDKPAPAPAVPATPAPAAPATPAPGAAPAVPVGGTAAPAAPVDGAAPVAPVDGAAPVAPVAPAPGTGVVAPAEPINPAPGVVAPAPGGVAPAPGGAVPAPGGVVPAPGGVAPVVTPVVPGFPGYCPRPFGGCHGYGFRPGYGW